LKILALSDIHLDINIKRKELSFTNQLISYLSQQSADVLVLTGDIAGNTRQIVDFFNKTLDLPFAYKIYVPGNHDIWVNQAAINLSEIKYYDILAEIAQQFGWYYLPNNPLILDNTVFLGTMGWYDYSTRNPIWDDRCSLSQYSQKKHPNGMTELMDRYFVKFGKTDREIAKQLNTDLSNDFNYIERRMSPDDIGQYVILTHMVPFEQFIPYRGLFRYDYFTAFYGNIALGDLIKRRTNRIPTHVIFGQTHIPKIKQLNSRLFGYCVPIGYPREYGKNIPLQKIFSNRIKSILL